MIAACNPDVYCDAAARREVKQILRAGKARHDREAFLAAAAKARLPEANAVALDRLEHENPFRLPGFQSPVEQHTLAYDSFDQSLEAFYFWLLDELDHDAWAVSKVSDTFLATPGSGLFPDLVRRQTQAQHEATKLLRDAQALIRDILRMAADRNGSPTAMESHPPNADGGSEAEQKLLQSRIETLKLYARWLGPHLRQARQLEQHAQGGAGLVSLFNTAAVELTLLAQREYAVAEDVDQGELPRMVLKTRRRVYCPVLIVEFRLRVAPERTSPGSYGYRGRFELTLTSYALNHEEIMVLRREFDRENLGEVTATVGGKAGEALQRILNEMEGVTARAAKTEAKPDDPNPFLALLGLANNQPEPEGERGTGSDQPAWWSVNADSDIEAVIRSQAILDARRRCLEFYDRCKARLGMATF
jgi:hypothetical protein